MREISSGLVSKRVTFSIPESAQVSCHTTPTLSDLDSNSSSNLGSAIGTPQSSLIGQHSESLTLYNDVVEAEVPAMVAEVLNKVQRQLEKEILNSMNMVSHGQSCSNDDE